MTDGQFSLLWPNWPAGASGTTCVDVQIGWSVDTTFDKLWGAGSEFSAHVREARNIKDYSEGPWVQEEDLEESITSGQQDKTPPSPRTFASRSGYTGHSRKVKFEQAASGGMLSSAYTNEEVQRCIEAAEGERYVMHCCISTNAPYGERIRIVLRYELTGVPDSSSACNLEIMYDVVWVKSTNSMLKYTVTTGIDMGVKKNFGTLRGLLSELVDVKDNVDDAAAPSDQAPPNPASAQQQDNNAPLSAPSPSPSPSPSLAPASALLGRLAQSEARLLRSAAPVAAWLDGGGGGRGAGAAGASRAPALMAKRLVAMTGGRDSAASALAVLAAGAVLWAALVLKGVLGERLGGFCEEEGCHPGFGQALCFLYSLGHVLDLPDSLREVLGAVAVLSAAQRLASVALSALPFAAVPQAAVAEAPSSSSSSATAAAAAATAAAATDRVQQQGASETGTRGLESFPEGSGAKSAAAVQAEVAKQLSNLGSGIKSGFKDISSSALRSLARTSAAPQQPEPPSPEAATEPPSSSSSAPEAVVAEDAAGDPGAESSPLGSPPPPAPSAEVFENERYQPLRGWGHTWPGHLMPGDFSHWSLPSEDSSMVFADVRPALPEGYHWTDPDWQIDLDAAEDEAVDEEGWSYGVHWKWLTNPPQAGSGRRKGSVFVRRRRWLRRWSPVPEGADPGSDDSKEPQPTKNPEEDKLATTLATMGAWDILRVGGNTGKDAAPRSSPLRPTAEENESSSAGPGGQGDQGRDTPGSDPTTPAKGPAPGGNIPRRLTDPEFRHMEPLRGRAGAMTAAMVGVSSPTVLCFEEESDQEQHSASPERDLSGPDLSLRALLFPPDNSTQPMPSAAVEAPLQEEEKDEGVDAAAPAVSTEGETEHDGAALKEDQASHIMQEEKHTGMATVPEEKQEAVSGALEEEDAEGDKERGKEEEAEGEEAKQQEVDEEEEAPNETSTFESAVGAGNKGEEVQIPAAGGSPASQVGTAPSFREEPAENLAAMTGEASGTAAAEPKVALEPCSDVMDERSPPSRDHSSSGTTGHSGSEEHRAPTHAEGPSREGIANGSSSGAAEALLPDVASEAAPLEAVLHNEEDQGGPLPPQGGSPRGGSPSTATVVVEGEGEGWLDSSFCSELLKLSKSEADAATPDTSISLGEPLSEAELELPDLLEGEGTQSNTKDKDEEAAPSKTDDADEEVSLSKTKVEEVTPSSTEKAEKEVNLINTKEKEATPSRTEKAEKAASRKSEEGEEKAPIEAAVQSRSLHGTLAQQQKPGSSSSTAGPPVRNKLKRIMQSAQQEGKKVSGVVGGVVGKTVSGAVASVGQVIGNVSAGTTHPPTQIGASAGAMDTVLSPTEPELSFEQDDSRETPKPSVPGAPQDHYGAFPTGDLIDLDSSYASDSGSASGGTWHKRAVSDMFKEVNLDNVQGTAQRAAAEMNVVAKNAAAEMNVAAKNAAAEMNVAAKKLTGEMNDAAKKLSGLFGRTVAVTRMGLSKPSADALDQPPVATPGGAAAGADHQQQPTTRDDAPAAPVLLPEPLAAATSPAKQRLHKTPSSISKGKHQD